MTHLKTLSLTVAALGALALPALADDHGWRGYHGGYRGGPRVSVGIGIAPFFYPGPYYYGPAPYCPPSYYEPAAPRPVVVGREVASDVAVDVQRVLARKGYYRGAIDGDLGPRSRAAIRAWQEDCGLAVTGQINSGTLRSLGLL